MKNFFIAALCGLSVSCASIDVRQKVKPPASAAKIEEKGTAIIALPLDIPARIVETPVYTPQEKKPAPPPVGYDAVKKSNAEGILKPKDYEHAAMTYDYDINAVYEVYCQPLRVTDIRLAAGEAALEPPYIADSERWMLGGGISHEAGEEVQHIYVKPTAAGIAASLVVNTSEREYHFLLRSYEAAYMPIVRFRYNSRALPQFWLGGKSKTAVNSNAGAGGGGEETDPRFLSFNYKIRYNFFAKPRWLPKLAYDDGKKTYITLPENILQTELPAIFENRSDILNFRVAENVIIIDKLIENVTIKLGKRSVSIEKLKGK